MNLIATAEHEITISAYSFTDAELASALIKKAAQGISIRVYSDHASAKSELSRAKAEVPIIGQLAKTNGITLRVKRSSLLAHIKAYEIDGKVLRTGSANFSKDAEIRQDNDLLIIRNSLAVSQFRTKFQQMWDRPDNETIN